MPTNATPTEAPMANRPALTNAYDVEKANTNVPYVATALPIASTRRGRDDRVNA